MQNEDKAKKDKIAQKKIELRKIQDSDFEDKMKFKNDHRARDKGTADFGDNNVLSYCYTTKESRAIAMGAKKDKMIELMKDQFIGYDRQGDHA